MKLSNSIFFFDVIRAVSSSRNFSKANEIQKQVRVKGEFRQENKRVGIRRGQAREKQRANTGLFSEFGAGFLFRTESSVALFAPRRRTRLSLGYGYK